MDASFIQHISECTTNLPCSLWYYFHCSLSDSPRVVLGRFVYCHNIANRQRTKSFLASFDAFVTGFQNITSFLCTNTDWNLWFRVYRKCLETFSCRNKIQTYFKPSDVSPFPTKSLWYHNHQWHPFLVRGEDAPKIALHTKFYDWLYKK